MPRCVHPLPVALLLALTATLPLRGQTRGARPVMGSAAVAAGPASLIATMSSYGAWLRWPPVGKATGYTLTRVNYHGQPETVISSRPATYYVFEGNNCVAGHDLPYCVYFDNQFRTTASNVTVTYRVYATIPGSQGLITTLPSPKAAVIWHCPDCPKLH